MASSRQSSPEPTEPPDVDRPTATVVVPFPGQAPEWPPSSLPLALTSLIGRDADAAVVSGLLDTSRLVTLVGIGGVGKTRLALYVAGLRTLSYRDGACFVELAALADPALVPRAVAHALDVTEQAGQPLVDTLVRSLRQRRVLLVLDNCEHLIEACAELAHTLLRSCAELQILATSRETLAIDGETVHQVLPLDTPPTEASMALPDLGEVAAVRLFVERARAVHAAFALTDQNASAIAQICRRLDGLPLALELATARIPSLSVQQIADRLDDRFRLLTTGRRGAPPRQQALRATLDWSYDLLSDGERVLLRRVAVFTGGWTLEAAEHVHRGEPAADDGDVLDALARLIGKSLVRVEHPAASGSAEPRYTLLETVRQYAWERLADAGEVEVARQRHAAWCVALAEQAEPGLFGPDQVTWLARLDREYDNIRASLAWTLDHDPSSALRLAASLWQFWRFRLYLSEGREWLERTLARAPEPTAVRAHALAAAGILAHWQLDVATTRHLYDEGMALARALDEPLPLCRMVRDLGYLTWSRLGDQQRAWELLAEAEALARAIDDGHEIASALIQQARLAAAQGEYRRAQACHDEGIVLLTEQGDAWLLAFILREAGYVALLLGQPERALSLFDEALARSRAMEQAGFSAGYWRYHQGTVAYWRGDAETAIHWFQQDLAIAQANGHISGMAECLAGLGQAVRLQGDVARADDLLAESLRLSTERQNGSGRGLALYGLGLTANAVGDDVLATARLRESLAARRETDEHLGMVECLEALVAIELSQVGHTEQAERALRWLGAADARREQMGTPRPPVSVPAYDGALEAAGRWLRDPGALLAAGAALPLPEIVADALRESPAEPSSKAEPAAREPLPAGLTARQVEVLQLLARGLTNVQIAETLVVSLNTVKHHVTQILNKTGSENRSAAVAFALRHNLA